MRMVMMMIMVIMFLFFVLYFAPGIDSCVRFLSFYLVLVIILLCVCVGGGGFLAIRPVCRVLQSGRGCVVGRPVKEFPEV